MVPSGQTIGTKEMDAPLATIPDMCLFCCSNCFCCLICDHCCLRKTNENTSGPKGSSLDVLRMNVWTPGGSDDVVPVMVWIHGGGDCGSAKMEDPNSRDGSTLASTGVVVCSIEFRQGIFGVMDWGDSSDVPTNLELRDMICALRFIRDHIKTFNGDPDCVTIFGESIGGRRVCELVACKAAAGLFHRAIACSPSAPEACNLSECHRTHRRQLVLDYLEMGGVDMSKATLSTIPKQKLLNAQVAAKGGLALLPRTKIWGATQEDKKKFGCGAQIPSSPLDWGRASLGFLNWRMIDGLRTGFFDACVQDGELMCTLVGDGHSADVPLILMYNANEYSALGAFPGLRHTAIKTRDHAVALLVNLLPVRGFLQEESLLKIAGNYFDDYSKLFDGASVGSVFKHIAEDTWQYHAVITMAKTHATAHPGKAYVVQYAYDHGGETPHGADVSTVFGKMPSIPIHKQGKDFKGMTNIMQSIWTNFAKSGNPSTDAVPFAAFDVSAPKMTVLNSVGAGGCKILGTHVDRETCYQSMVSALRAAES
eukprot:TRINITY_DN71491_c0_g1_i1.p1 TRINITY_DN71491_c0_g1~~TRINITY_DN71491_c0_g1_i1.p1  ORF type:complete len:537 (+),score=64.27 TRINITY_DN71491_c0_g1_i1:111-1721(+)